MLFLKNKKIKTKLLIVILSISIISLIILGFISLYNTKNLGRYAVDKSTELGNSAARDSELELQKQAKYYLLRLAENQANLSNNIFEKVEAEVELLVWYTENLWNNKISAKPEKSFTSEDIPENGEFPSVLRIVPNADKIKIEKDIKISGNLDNIFKKIHDNNKNIESVYLGSVNGLHRRYPWTSAKKSSYDPRDRNWYKQAVSTGKLGWTELYISASKEILMVTCCKPAYDKKNNLIGVIGVDITLESLNNKIINTQIGDLGYAILIDKNGKIIADKEMSKKGKKWDQSLETDNLLKGNNPQLREIAVKMTNGEKGVGQCVIDNSKKYLAYAPVTTTNWSLGIIMPIDEIIHSAKLTKNKIIKATTDSKQHIETQIKKILVIIGLIFIFILLMVIFVSDELAKKITDPIQELDKGANIIGEGNLDYHFKIDTGDELQDLAAAFNHMACDIKTYIKNLQETTAAKERIESELKIAYEIQSSFLPRIFPPFPKRREFDIYASMEPAKEVGGDFYDFALVSENKLFFTIGDVSGKGVPAALFMVIMKTLLKNEALRGLPPDKILYNVNNVIARDNDTSMFATIFCGIFDIETGEIEYSNAGHNPPLKYKNGEYLYPLKKSW
ncbi:SpoIIE family protein phosphatase [Candidatus Desantisbacteria bacterium]|nr:SpoIIE family protein phosphatase [Candidatus Desantisbacteria bacterium]